MLPDSPLALDDFLALDEEKARLESLLTVAGSFLRHAPRESLILAISGEWGTGKTSYLRSLGEYLKEYCGYPVVFFEAWRYQPEKDPLVSLMTVLMEEKYFQSRRQIIKEKILKPLLVSGLFLSDILLSRVTSRGLRDLVKVFNLIEEKQMEWVSRVRSAQKALQELIEELLRMHRSPTSTSSKNDRALNFPREPWFVLIVDDLDRLIPEEAFRLLEALRFYFHLPRLLILMGINDRILNNYVEKVYGLGREHQENFMEKIFTWKYELSLGELNSLHLRSIEQVLDREDLNNLKDFGREVIGRLSHRKWVRFLNRLEKGLHEGLNLSLPYLVDTTLKELFPEYEYLTRSYPGLTAELMAGTLEDSLWSKVARPLKEGPAFVSDREEFFRRLQAFCKKYPSIFGAPSL